MAQPSTGKALSPSTNLAQIANIVSAMTNLRCSSMVSGLKTHEFSFEPLQSIFGGLGRATTHDQSPDVRLLLHQGPLGLGKCPICGECCLVVSSGHIPKMRLYA